MKLDEDDKIIGVKICREDQDIILSTKLGKCIRFMSKKLRIFKGRSSKGIKGIELGADDKVISLSVLNTVDINPKTAKKLIKNGSVDKDKKSEIIAKQKYILSTDKGKVIRCAVKEIRIGGRNTQGVRIFKLSGEEKVVSAIKIEDNFI